MRAPDIENTELDMTSLNDNPLLDFSGLPHFDRIQPEHIESALDLLIQESESALDLVKQQIENPTWSSFITPLENANERLSRAWGQVAHLNAVVNTPPLRAAYNAMLPRIAQYWARLGQDQELYTGYRTLHDNPEFSSFPDARQRIITRALRDFRLGGVELPDNQKARFLEIQETLAALTARFEQNLLDATLAFSYDTQDVQELDGLPPDVIAQAAETARQANHTGWRLTLHAPCYIPVMQYATKRGLREHFYRCYTTRASEYGPPQWNNGPLIKELLALRAEEAHLLGFDHFAELSIEPKMADSPIQVMQFLRNLAQRAKPFAQQDWQTLTEFALNTLHLPNLQPWDLAFVSEKLRTARYDYSEQQVREYFPEDAVLSGLFQVIEHLYGLHVRPATAPIWHETVRFYELRNAQQQLIGQFYLDLYARSGKRGGAWMDDAIGRRRLGDSIQIPVAYLSCNFSAPSGNRPATFTHDEVITLFHECGHGLHHLLTQMEDLSVSGISGVEWDAVELPSQFMENFCWEWEVLKTMTRQIDSGDPLPRELYDRMLSARHFQSGMQTLRQIEFSLFDMELHCLPPQDSDPLVLLERIRAEIAVVHPPVWHRFPHSFSHIFSGGYAAGYYSYKWAEVLSADAYALFEESGIFNTDIGQRFLNEILAVGSSRPALDSFIAFRGRPPELDALLRHHGMVNDSTKPIT